MDPDVLPLLADIVKIEKVLETIGLTSTLFATESDLSKLEVLCITKLVRGNPVRVYEEENFRQIGGSKRGGTVLF